MARGRSTRADLDGPRSPTPTEAAAQPTAMEAKVRRSRKQRGAAVREVRRRKPVTTRGGTVVGVDVR